MDSENEKENSKCFDYSIIEFIGLTITLSFMLHCLQKLFESLFMT